MSDSRRSFLLVALGFTLGCGGSTSSTAKVSRYARLVIQCEVAEAEIWLNSRYYKTASEITQGARLRAGSYRIEVRHSDFHSMYYEIKLAAAETRTLAVELAPRYR